MESNDRLEKTIDGLIAGKELVLAQNIQILRILAETNTFLEVIQENRDLQIQVDKAVKSLTYALSHMAVEFND